jgi:hypothetical protein
MAKREKKERVPYEFRRRAGWVRGFLKVLEKAGPDIVAGVFATIDARADEYENPVFAQAIKIFAREVLDDAKSREERAIALRRYSWTIDGGAYVLGWRDCEDYLEQIRLDGAAKKHEKLLAAIRQALDEAPSRIGPKSIRPAVLQKLNLPAATPLGAWPTERTIKGALADIRRERGIPLRKRAS